MDKYIPIDFVQPLRINLSSFGSSECWASSPGSPLDLQPKTTKAQGKSKTSRCRRDHTQDTRMRAIYTKLKSEDKGLEIERKEPPF